MIRKIMKRDGKISDFNPIKITNAIWKAAQAVGGKDYRKAGDLTDIVLERLSKELKKGEIPTVEQVQDIVEKALIEEGHAKTAKAYILYRKQHQDIREIGGLLKDIDVVDGYLSMMDWKVNENSNMSYSLQGLNVYATENIVSHYWLNKIYPPDIGESHTQGNLHIHDLGTLGAYCVGWDLKDILLLGFRGVSGKIESKPAKHFGTAMMQIVNYLYTLQGEAAGAQALSNFDTLLAPFIRYDGLKYDQVKQEMQKFLFNMNVPTRVGFQSPFTNITLDLTVPSYMVDEPAIIGGNLKDDNYSDFTDEMDMINHAFADIMYEGDAKGRPFTFPIPTYNITKDFNWNNDGLDPIWEMTAKYGIPYFSNFINSDMKPEDARSMCCRLRLSNRELRKRGGGLFGANPKTGCYDEKTEVLTENGWKFFKDVNKNEKVFTLTENNKIELYKPTRFFEYDYDNEMYHFKSRSFDLLVTPNHRMLVDNTWTKERKFVEAKDFIPNTHRIPKQGIWNCTKKNYFELPPVRILGGSGTISRFSDNETEAIRVAKREGKSIYQLAKKFNCSPVTIHNICKHSKYGNRERVRVRYETPSLKIKMDDWLKFFGFWLAEGCTDNEKNAKTHGYRVVITQIDKQKRKEIMRVLDSLPFNYNLDGKANFVICNKQLWTYLNQFGDKYTKFIPREIKELTRKKLKILFDWMVKGDGHERQSTGQINYWTSSKKLADDFQEVVLKLGWLATIKAMNKNISKIKGRKITPRIVYKIGVHRKSKHFRLRKKSIERKHYKGRVFCLEVPNHTLYVRRNGKPCWCGNSIGVVTINMPQIGYLAKDDNDFFQRLDQVMELAKQSLEIKREIIENLTHSGLHPYSRFYLQDVKKTFGEYWKNHFSTIGLIGMNDALLNFMNKSIGDNDGKVFAEKVLDYMRDKIANYQEETGDIFNLEATPAEGASYRLSRVDKKQYPDIRIYNQEKYNGGNGGKGVEPYYTNSTQLPVGYTSDVFEALDLQDTLQSKYTGGTVLHIYLGEENPSSKAVKKLIRKVAQNYTLPYYTLTPTFSVCPDHGYISGEHQICPICKGQNKTIPCEVYSRVVGYLRPVSQWNLGKQQEYSDRKMFNMMEKKVMVTK